MRHPYNFSSARFLRMIGLQTRRSAAAIVLPTVGLFGIGLLTGAGLGLLFAPRKGAETRRELGTRITDVSHRVTHAANTVARRFKRSAQQMGDEVSSALDDARDATLYGGNGVGSSEGYLANR